ncbi:MAG: hypothetical protein WCF16_08790 [Alphaproteobacteria bacterium]
MKLDTSIPTDPHRAFTQRRHRIIGQYVALQAWIRGLDCIVLQRRHLLALLHIERIEGARLDTFKADVSPWFPRSEVFYSPPERNTFASIFMSRFSLSDVPGEAMSDEDRIGYIRNAGIFTGDYHDDHWPFWEHDIVTMLSLMASGLTIPPPAATSAMI